MFQCHETVGYGDNVIPMIANGIALNQPRALRAQDLAASTDGVPTGSTNQATVYTYDGDGHVLTMTAVLPTGQNSQTTQYVYGIGATIGTDLFSNDLIARVEYPDLSTGAASSSAANESKVRHHRWHDYQPHCGPTIDFAHSIY